MHEDACRAAEYEPKLLRLAKVSAGQVPRPYDQHAFFRQGIFGNRHAAAAKRAADSLLEFGTALGSRIDYVRRYISSNSARLTSAKSQEDTDHTK